MVFSFTALAVDAGLESADDVDHFYMRLTSAEQQKLQCERW
jgi:hypothetical protein